MVWFGNVLTGAFILLAFTHLVKSVFILPLAYGSLPRDYHVTIFCLYGLVLHIKKSFLIMTYQSTFCSFIGILLYFLQLVNILKRLFFKVSLRTKNLPLEKFCPYEVNFLRGNPAEANLVAGTAQRLVGICSYTAFALQRAAPLQQNASILLGFSIINLKNRSSLLRSKNTPARRYTTRFCSIGLFTTIKRVG